MFQLFFSPYFASIFHIVRLHVPFGNGYHVPCRDYAKRSLHESNYQNIDDAMQSNTAMCCNVQCMCVSVCVCRRRTVSISFPSIFISHFVIMAGYI